MEEIPFPLLVLLIVAAVVAGLFLGAKAGKIAPASNDGKPRKTIGARVRGAATDGVVRFWKWNRNRKKKDE